MKKLKIMFLVLVSLTVFSCSTHYAYPLHTLVRTGTLEEIKQFLEDPKQKAKYINLVKDGKYAPLAEALAAGRDIAIIRLLVEAGADANWDKSSEAPLITAIKTQQISDDTILYLIEAGADVNAPRTSDASPLLEAVKHRGAALVSTLLQKGADLSGEFWIKALVQAAVEREDFAIISVLSDAGIPLPYSKDWYQFVAAVRLKDPVAGALLSYLSLRHIPLPENEAVLMKLWKTWDDTEKQDERFLSPVLERASSQIITAQSATILIEGMKQNWERYLEHFNYLENHSKVEERQKYLEGVLCSAVRNDNQIIKTQDLRNEFSWILANYKIDLNFVFKTSEDLDKSIELARVKQVTPLIYALATDFELTKLFLNYGAEINFPAKTGSDGSYYPFDPALPFNVLINATRSFYELANRHEHTTFKALFESIDYKYQFHSDYYKPIIDLFESYKAISYMPIMKQFIEAFNKADFTKMESMIKQYPELKEPDFYISSHVELPEYPVLSACSAGNIETLLFLLNQGFYSDLPIYTQYRSYSPWMACERSLININTIAICENKYTVLHLLLTKHFQDSVGYHHTSMLAEDLKEAAKSGFNEVLKILIESQISINSNLVSYEDNGMTSNIYTETLLHCAVLGGHIDTVQYLLDNSLNVNALAATINEWESGSNYIFKTPLDYCPSTEEGRAIAALLKSKSGISYKDAIADPVKYKALILSWNLPYCIGSDELHGILTDLSGKKNRKIEDDEKLTLLSQNGDYEGYLVLDSKFRLWNLIKDPEYEDESYWYVNFEDNGWASRDRQTIEFQPLD